MQVTYRPEIVIIEMKPVVVSWLADANGKPVQYLGEVGVFNHDPVFVKTKIWQTEAEAWAMYDTITAQYPDAAFVSIQDERGESLA